MPQYTAFEKLSKYIFLKIFLRFPNIFPKKLILKLMKKNVLRTPEKTYIFRDTSCITISNKHYIYLSDILNNFDDYFTAVEPKNLYAFSWVDYSYPHKHSVVGYEAHQIMFPSFAEPISTAKQYLNFAQLQPDSIVFDLGAYSGLTSILFDIELTKHNKTAAGRVYAVEADNKNIPIIQENFREYKNSREREITLLHAAVSDKNGVAHFSSEGNMGSTLTDFLGARGDVIKVPTMTLSAIAEKYQLKKVDFIKCDIEGAEIYIFKDMDFFKKYSPKIIFEAHWLYEHEKADYLSTEICIDILSTYGYTCSIIKQVGVTSLPLIQCEKV